jgi:ribosome-binding factor A
MADDLRSARVHVSVFGAKDQFAKTVAALNHARGHLRSLVGRNCGLRYAPDLHFTEDHTLERGARIEELLRAIPKAEPADDPGEAE